MYIKLTKFGDYSCMQGFFYTYVCSYYSIIKKRTTLRESSVVFLSSIACISRSKFSSVSRAKLLLVQCAQACMIGPGSLAALLMIYLIKSDVMIKRTKANKLEEVIISSRVDANRAG